MFIFDPSFQVAPLVIVSVSSCALLCIFYYIVSREKVFSGSHAIFERTNYPLLDIPILWPETLFGYIMLCLRFF